mgnify:CR=1 FL=1
MNLEFHVVNKNVLLNEYVNKKIEEKVTKLGLYLQPFSPDACHLQIHLQRHPLKKFITCELNLRIPSHTLHSEKSAPAVITALDLAVSTLAQELKTLKSKLRGNGKKKVYAVDSSELVDEV